MFKKDNLFPFFKSKFIKDEICVNNINEDEYTIELIMNLSNSKKKLGLNSKLTVESFLFKPYLFLSDFKSLSTIEMRKKAYLIIQYSSGKINLLELSYGLGVGTERARQIFSKIKKKINIYNDHFIKNIDFYFMFFNGDPVNLLKINYQRDIIDIFFTEYTKKISGHSLLIIEAISPFYEKCFENLFNKQEFQKFWYFPSLDIDKNTRFILFRKDVIEYFGLYSEIKIEHIYDFYLGSPLCKYQNIQWNLRAFTNRMDISNSLSFVKDVTSSKKIIIPIILNEKIINSFLLKKFEEYFISKKSPILSFNKFVEDEIIYSFIMGNSELNKYFDKNNSNLVENISPILYKILIRPVRKNAENKFSSFRFPILYKESFVKENKIKEVSGLALYILKDHFPVNFNSDEILNNYDLTVNIGIEKHWWTQNILKLEKLQYFEKGYIIEKRRFYQWKIK